MTEEQVKEYLKNRGCPERVWQHGSADLKRRWQNFVTEVETGNHANCCIEDYWNDLDSLELIHDIGCDADVKETDERFAAILPATHIKHWHADRRSNYDFWIQYQRPTIGTPRNCVVSVLGMPNSRRRR
jgi:hypothetical protein